MNKKYLTPSISCFKVNINPVLIDISGDDNEDSRTVKEGDVFGNFFGEEDGGLANDGEITNVN